MKLKPEGTKLQRLKTNLAFHEQRVAYHEKKAEHILNQLNELKANPLNHFETEKISQPLVARGLLSIYWLVTDNDISGIKLAFDTKNNAQAFKTQWQEYQRSIKQQYFGFGFGGFSVKKNITTFNRIYDENVLLMYYPGGCQSYKKMMDNNTSSDYHALELLNQHVDLKGIKHEFRDPDQNTLLTQSIESLEKIRERWLDNNRQLLENNSREISQLVVSN